MKTALRLATLLLTAALAFPAERNVSGPLADPVRNDEPTCAHAARSWSGVTSASEVPIRRMSTLSA